jgi:TatD DNase family protein
MIDSHCHLAGSEYLTDLDAVVTRARDAGVTAALVILGADDVEEVQRSVVVGAAWPEVRFAAGVHPHAAGKYGDNPARATSDVEEALTREGRIRAIGEIGLDYHYDFAPRDVQQAVFAAQLRLARRRRLPVVIHTREAEDDTFRVLADEHAGETAVVFHCFTGDKAMARRALDAGFYLSLAGIVTFPKALELKEVAALVPADRLLIETDSPFLAPVPHRGKRNEPAHVVRVAETVAALRGVSVAEVAETTQVNFQRLFHP